MKHEACKIAAVIVCSLFLVACVAVGIVLVTSNNGLSEGHKSNNEIQQQINDKMMNEESENEAVDDAEAEGENTDDVSQQEYEYVEYEYTEPVYYPESSDYSYQSGDCLTKSGGVYYYNGRKETWYSSRSAYHYKTPEWNLGSDGVYRDSDGYVIVAASDLNYGDTVETSLGTGKVYDSGCANGITDIYVGW